MKKLLIGLILLFMFIATPATLLAYNNTSMQTTIAQQLTFPKPEELFGQENESGDRTNEDGQVVDDEIDEEGQDRKVELPKGNLILDILPRMLNWALFLMGTVLLIVLVFAGVQLLISRSDEERIKTAKMIITDVIIGAVITGVAYAMVSGLITTLQNL